MGGQSQRNLNAKQKFRSNVRVVLHIMFFFDSHLVIKKLLNGKDASVSKNFHELLESLKPLTSYD